MLNIVIPLAGKGAPFKEAGYAFPKPLIDINGKTMIEVVVENLRPKTDHRFIFVCLKELYDTYDIYNILHRATQNKFEIVKIYGPTEGAACTVLAATQYINNNDELLIANSDQYIEFDINAFIRKARIGQKDGFILTFESSHPRWSYARTDKVGKVIEVAEKKVISNNATVGIYYFKNGSDFVTSAQSMIYKNIRYNNEFYVSPTYNELILERKNIFVEKISDSKMHSLGTPEDVHAFVEHFKPDK